MPLLLLCAGRDRPAKLCHALRRIQPAGSVIDIAPTLLQLAGLLCPGNYPGTVVAATGRSGPGQGAVRFLTDHAVYQVGLRQDPGSSSTNLSQVGRSYSICVAIRRSRQDLAASQPQRVAAFLPPRTPARLVNLPAALYHVSLS